MESLELGSAALASCECYGTGARWSREKSGELDGIDRIVLAEDKKICCVYDYKLEGGNPERHVKQMDIYEKAVRNIFPDRPVVRRFIVFLKTGTLHEI